MPNEKGEILFLQVVTPLLNGSHTRICNPISTLTEWEMDNSVKLLFYNIS